MLLHARVHKEEEEAKSQSKNADEYYFSQSPLRDFRGDARGRFHVMEQISQPESFNRFRTWELGSAEKSLNGLFCYLKMTCALG